MAAGRVSRMVPVLSSPLPAGSNGGDRSGIFSLHFVCGSCYRGRRIYLSDEHPRPLKTVALLPVPRIAAAGVALLGLLVLGACDDPLGIADVRDKGKIVGQESNAAGGVENVIGVNAFLWRASLDTVSFMPLAAGDPFGGTIITDWYAPAGTPDERFKITVYVLGREFHASSLKVALFRQVRDAMGTWVDAPANPEAALNLENKILERAHQLRQASFADD